MAPFDTCTQKAAVLCMPKIQCKHLTVTVLFPQVDPHELQGSQAQYVRVPLADSTLVQVGKAEAIGAENCMLVLQLYLSSAHVWPAGMSGVACVCKLLLHESIATGVSKTALSLLHLLI